MPYEQDPISSRNLTLCRSHPSLTQAQVTTSSVAEPRSEAEERSAASETAGPVAAQPLRGEAQGPALVAHRRQSDLLATARRGAQTDRGAGAAQVQCRCLHPAGPCRLAASPRQTPGHGRPQSSTRPCCGLWMVHPRSRRKEEEEEDGNTR